MSPPDAERPGPASPVAESEASTTRLNPAPRLPTDDLLGWALAYAARGWPVLPLKPRLKTPATANGLLDATTDAEQISRWWTAAPTSNIGLRTGIAFDALDLDGLHALDELDRAGAEMTGNPNCGTIIGPCNLTGRGVHILVEPTGRKNTANIRPGIDWRGDGGYVVAPPSVHPNGAVYEWGATYGIDTPLQPVPDWFMRVWDEKANPPVDSGVTRVTPGGSRYGAQALDGELGRLIQAPEGARNDTLVRAAFRIGQLVASGDLDAASAADQLLVVALRTGLDQREAETTIASGVGAGYGRPRQRRAS